MVVNDLDLIGVSILPAKADAPLIVHPNTVLASAISFELLEAIARRHPKVFERLRGVDGDELAEHAPQEVCGKANARVQLQAVVSICGNLPETRGVLQRHNRNAWSAWQLQRHVRPCRATLQ